jgi:hypothetical protein
VTAAVAGFVQWLSRFLSGGVIPLTWVVVVLTVVVLLVAAGVVAVRPASRRWGRANRLHRLESRTQRTTRINTRKALDEAVRALESAKRDCLASAERDDADRIDRLLVQVAVVRDRVASEYSPTLANLPNPRRELSLDCWSASESVGELCIALARRVRGGAHLEISELAQAERAAADLDRQVAPL